MNFFLSPFAFIVFFILAVIPSCTYSTPSLKRDTAVIAVPGIDLKSVYRRLEKAGFHPGPYQEDDLTQLSGAIRRFQRFAKLEPTGILDKYTWDRLRILYDPIQSQKTAPAKIKKIKPSATYRNYPVDVNDRVFAVEKFECSDVSGDWLTFYEGTVTDAAGETFSVRLGKRFGYRYHPEKEGIDNTDWWCVPQKRHCYSAVKFSDWQGQYAENQVVSFPKQQVYNADTGIINGISDFLRQNCKRQ